MSLLDTQIKIHKKEYYVESFTNVLTGDLGEILDMVGKIIYFGVKKCRIKEVDFIKHPGLYKIDASLEYANQNIVCVSFWKDDYSPLIRASFYDVPKGYAPNTTWRNDNFLLNTFKEVDEIEDNDLPLIIPNILSANIWKGYKNLTEFSQYIRQYELKNLKLELEGIFIKLFS